MNATTQTARLSNDNNSRSRKAAGSRTGGKPDTVAKTAAAAETLAAPVQDPALRNADLLASAAASAPATGTARGASVSDIFSKHREATREKVQLKLSLLQTARQFLAEAKDFYDAGDAEAVKAKEAQDKGAFKLYQARASGLLSSDELNGVLGDIWGMKMKGDAKATVPMGHPQASKTPAGNGEAIRKRIVRTVSAMEFVGGGDGGRFFEPLEPEEVQPILDQLNEGGMSIWTAYDKLGELKSKDTTRIDPAYNPAIIAKIVEKLGSPGSAGIIARSPGLVEAYGALLDVLGIVGRQAAALVAADEAKAAKPLPAGAVA